MLAALEAQLGNPAQIARVALASTLGLLRGRGPRGARVAQLFQIGTRSLLFIAATLGFIGLVLVFQTCLQVSRITGDLSLVGAEFIKILVHEFGPTLTAMMLATRVGAGIAAEVGSMVVTEQVDALCMNNIDPIDYLLVPRLGASLVAMPALCIFGIAVAVVAGTLTAAQGFGVNPSVFLSVDRVHAADVFTGLVKCVAYGAAIPIVSGASGLAQSKVGGSEGVGAATTRAVIASSFAVLVLDFCISGVAMATWQAGS